MMALLKPRAGARKTATTRSGLSVLSAMALCALTGVVAMSGCGQGNNGSLPGVSSTPLPAPIWSQSPVPGNLTITTGPLPNGAFGSKYGTHHSLHCYPGHGTTGCPYSWYGFDLDVVGGNPPYTWSASSLPLGLQLMQQRLEGYQFCGTNCYTPLIVPAMISGVPISSGTFSLTLTVTDSSTPALLGTAYFRFGIAP